MQKLMRLCWDLPRVRLGGLTVGILHLDFFYSERTLP
jgi:hypothetical protein